MKAPISILACLLFAAGFLQAQTTQPIVAIHDSELTRAFETQAASNGVPPGTGKQWWTTNWHYFVMPEALQEMFRSDGTRFAVVHDADITAGSLLTNGVPKYPIMFSLASEAMRDDEIAPLTNYVAAGGFLFVGSSAFTRNTNGTTRGNFAIAAAMGVNMASNTLSNWGQDNYLTTLTNQRIINDIPPGQNIWRMPTYSEEISWGTDPNHPAPPAAQLPHYIWQVQAAGATVLAQGDNYPYILIQQYGKGCIIYDAAFQPLIGHGGFAPGMYAYMIFRRSVEWAFEAANLPVPKLSAWPYPYDSAYMVRHDLENYPNEIADLLQSAKVEFTNGAKGDYYFCTGTLRSDMSSNYVTNLVVNNLRTAVSTYGATIGPHNGGLMNLDNFGNLTETNGVGSSYDYWHWGQDELLDIAGPFTNNGTVYANGQAYALSSTTLSFQNVESWLSGLESSSMRLWCTPYFNGTRENSYIIQSQANVKITGDQKLGPFPHWTVSTQTSGKRYAMLSEPVSDWFVGGLVAQSLEPWHPPGVHNSASMHSAVDFFYGIGALINIYSHTLATGEGDAGALMPDYLTYCANTNLHPRLWAANGVGIYQWWLQRSNVVVNVSYATNGSQSAATFAISGSSNTNTTVELLIPATTSFCSLQVLTNGVLAGTNGYRVNGQLVKVLVGTKVTNAVIQYYPMTPGVQVFAQNFDSVTAPALPSGWSSTVNGAGSPWTTVTNTNDTAANSVFMPDATFINLSDLITPIITLPSGQEQLTFQNNYNLESGSGGDAFDGGVLEIKIGGGPFTDIIAAGGSFVTGGYNSTIDTNYQNPLAGRPAWSGNSGGFIATTINLPPAAAGTNVQFRWRCGSDNGNAAVGWWIDTITITDRVCQCCGTNTPPTLPSQTNLSLPELAGLTVTNTASDPDLPLFYELLSPPPGAAIDTNGIITWTPQQAQSPGTYAINTLVMDNGSPPMIATNSFNVTVTEVNVAPALGSPGPQTINELAPLTVNNAATEPNIHSVTTGYGLVSPPAGVTINGSGVIHWTPQQTQSPGSYTLTTVVTNSNPYDTNNPSFTATNSFSVTVKEANVAPTPGSPGPQTVNELVPLTVTNAATESNIHSVTTGYGLLSPPSGAGINSNGVITWTPQQNQSPGSYTIKTVVTNSNPYDTVNPSLKTTNSFTVTVKEVNVAPVLGSPGPQTVNELAPLTVTNAATEPNIHSVTAGYGLVSPPAGATINGSGVIHWTPLQNQSPGSYTITTVVTNSNTNDSVHPSLTATNSFSVAVKEVNVAPALGNPGPQTANELVPLTVANAATEPNVHSVTTGYGLLGPPAGAGINSNGVITWTPQQNQSPGSYTLMTVVTNSNPFDTNNPGLTATNSFSVTVKEVNVVPALGNPGPQTVNELVPLTVTNAAIEPNVHSVTTGYSLLSPPTGANIDSNGVITWTPQQNQSPGAYTIKTVVTNSNPYDAVNPNLTATNIFSVTVNEVNVAPALGNPGPQAVNELVALTVTNAATESNIHSVTTGYGLLSPPSGANIDSNGVITWTPQQNQSPGSYTLTTVVTNSNPYDAVNPSLTATNSFSVAVNELNVAPALGNPGPQTVGELAPMIVTNAATEPNVHSVTTGYGLLSPPSGVNIDSNGVITWTPQQSQSPGSYTITTVVTNNDPYDAVNPSLTATNSFSVLVKEVNVAPALGNPGPQVVNELVPLTVTNAAAEPNIHSLTTGYGLLSPPSGANIDSNGVITWTPQQNQSPGSYTITTVVTNSNTNDAVHPSLTATNNFSVTVNEVNVAPALGNPGPQTVNELVPLTVTNAAIEPNVHSVTTGYGLLSPPTGANIDSNGVITWTPQQNQSPGSYTLTTVVTNSDPYDAVNPSLTATNSFNVTVTEVNVAPVLSAIGPQTANELVPLIVTNAAIESNLHSVTTGYGLVSPPAGAGIDSNGVITWTPQQNQSPGSYTLTTVVTNSNPYDAVNPSLTATNSFNVTVTEVNVAPVLSAIGPLTANELVPLIVTNAAIESNLHSVTTGYGLVSPPAGAGIDSNGVITWTPQQNQSPGSYTLTTVVTNSNPYDAVNPSLTATNSFSVTVNEVNVAPALGNPGPQPVNELVPLTVTNAAIEPNVHSVTTGYGLLSPPTGANIDSNGVITWTPQQNQSPGSYTLTTVVTNSNPYDTNNPSLTATNSFSVTVNEVNVAPILTATNDQNAIPLVPFTVTNLATEPNIHSVTTGYGLVNPPAGASVDTNGVITWTPAPNQQLSTNAIVTVVTNFNSYDVVNPSLAATNTFNIIVGTANTPPVLPSLNDVNIDENTQLVVTNTAADADIPANVLTYQLISPPTNAFIDTNGVITWSPGEAAENATNVIVTVVTDNGVPPLSATNSFNVTVTDPVIAPTILSVTLTNNVATILWTSVPGHSYTLQYRDDAGNGWINVMPPVSASGNTASTTNMVGNAPQRFYQVVTSPEHFHHH